MPQAMVMETAKDGKWLFGWRCGCVGKEEENKKRKKEKEKWRCEGGLVSGNVWVGRRERKGEK